MKVLASEIISDGVVKGFRAFCPICSEECYISIQSSLALDLFHAPEVQLCVHVKSIEGYKQDGTVISYFEFGVPSERVQNKV